MASGVDRGWVMLSNVLCGDYIPGRKSIREFDRAETSTTFDCYFWEITSRLIGEEIQENLGRHDV